MTRLWTGLLVSFVTGCTSAAVNDDKAQARDTPAVGDSARSSAAVVVIDSAPGAIAVTASPDTTAAITLGDELSVLASTLIIPVQGIIASQLRDSYTSPRAGHGHEALDIMAPRGTPVLSAADGRVTKLHKSVAGGNMVYAADASDRFILMYAHLDRYADGLAEKQPITRGQVLGYVGSTGDASAAAPHLHFAIARGRPSVEWWKGEAVNPYPLFVPSASSSVAAAPIHVDTVATPALPAEPTTKKPIEPTAKRAVAPREPAAKRVIEATAKRAIAAISAHDMIQLSSLVHPTLGVRFSPYQHVDKKTDRLLKKEQVKNLWASGKISIWGTHDGSGAPLRLTYPEYHKSFVYDTDFRHAPTIAFDSEPIGRGTIANNISDVYPGAMVVEYHAPGRDPKAGGRDRKSLSLVFQKQGATWYLVGIVHGGN